MKTKNLMLSTLMFGLTAFTDFVFVDIAAGSMLVRIGAFVCGILLIAIEIDTWFSLYLLSASQCTVIMRGNRILTVNDTKPFMLYYCLTASESYFDMLSGKLYIGENDDKFYVKEEY